MKKIVVIMIIASIFIGVNACNETSSTDPNDIGGSGDVEFTRVGDRTLSYFRIDDNEADVNDSIVVVKNNNGIVTTSAQFVLDSNTLKTFDKLLDAPSMTSSEKFALINSYIYKYNGSIDTTNKNAIKIKLEIKSKVTTDGIVTYMKTKSGADKPFLLVKYSGGVGDKYSYTDDENKQITREIKYKSTTDDYPVLFWRIKVLKVEEKGNDPLIEKITYTVNHKFGPVGVDVELKNGKKIKVTLSPPNM